PAQNVARPPSLHRPGALRDMIETSFPKYRAATYNIHGCVGTDGRHSPERIAEVINELDADVVALQEVATREHGGETTDQLEWLAERTGHLPIAGTTFMRGPGRFGNALLTRHMPLRVHRHDLSVPGFEPRGALDV